MPKYLEINLSTTGTINIRKIRDYNESFACISGMDRTLHAFGILTDDEYGDDTFRQALDEYWENNCGETF